MNNITELELGQRFYIDFKRGFDLPQHVLKKKLQGEFNMTLFKSSFICACAEDGYVGDYDLLFTNALIDFGIDKFPLVEQNPLHNIIELSRNYTDVRLLTLEEFQIMEVIASAGSLKEELQIVDPFVQLTYWG